MKPRALRKGSHLAIVSPASTPRTDLVVSGAGRLQALGYRTTIFPHALASGPIYYAGGAEHRAKDLSLAFEDPSVDGIVCARGGWGSAELLPLLNAELIAANPKIFVGYSDITSLQIWLTHKVGLVSFYAPMVAADFSRTDGVDIESWTSVLHGSANLMEYRDGLEVLQGGSATGILQGGCLSILTESLGTPYAPLPVPGEAQILFLEDIGTKPYQWDRMLLHLRYSGLLASVKGIIFGDMAQCVTPEEMPLLRNAILHALVSFTGPIALGLRCGHVNGPNITLPLGARVRLDLDSVDAPVFQLLEHSVRV